jgi:signal transduction histidine kinase
VQIERLKRTLLQWIDELFGGPHDEAYFERRARVGRVHVQIDLPQVYLFTAMDRIRQFAAGIGHELRNPLGVIESSTFLVGRRLEQLQMSDLAVATCREDRRRGLAFEEDHR